MKKIIIAIILFLVGVNSVDASMDKIYIGEKIPDVYIRKVSSDGEEKVKQGLFIRRSSDNQFVYCVEPFISLVNNHTYNSYDNNQYEYLGISKSTWEKISLIAYYGYKYADHQEDYWYYITQVMIWREIDPDAEFYFTSTLGGDNNPDLYVEEILEIEELVRLHQTVPEFEEATILLGDTITLLDKNSVLNNFDVIGDNASINDNNLVVSGNQLGTNKVVLKRESNNYECAPIVYVDPASQNVLAVGKLPDINAEVSFEVVGSKMKIVKIDAITKETVNIAGIKFLIYDANTNELVLEGVTNESGVFESDYVLGKGRYKIVEAQDQVIPGYEVSKEEIYFEVCKQEEVVIEYANKYVTGELKVIKLNEDNLVIPGVTFGLYDESGNLVNIIKTDEDGEALFTDLRAGKYKLKELETVSGYVLDEQEYNIELKLNSDNAIEMQIVKVINYYQKGNLEIVKVDPDNNPIPDVEFTLYNENMEEVAREATNNEGKIYIEDLKLGKYYLEETKTSLGYQILEERIEFDITSDKKNVTITVTNEPIKVFVPDTNISYEIAEFIVPKKKIIQK